MDKAEEFPANGQPEVTPEPRATAATAGGTPQVVQHAPLPWRSREAPDRFWGWSIDGPDVAGIAAAAVKADAAFIVTACNHHYTLIETVRQLKDAHREMFALLGVLVDQMEEILPDVPMTVAERAEAETVIASARAALAFVAAKPVGDR